MKTDVASFLLRHDLDEWEGRFSPYDEDLYRAVLEHVAPTDVVIEIGAGDLRLALRLAREVQQVYAIEVNPLLVARALERVGLSLPRNLVVICANALDFPVPAGVTVAVLLMRHCRHFSDYFDRLQAAGCRWLLTNARWKCGLEVVDLTAPRVPFGELAEGWYACRCGAVGYVGTGSRPDTAPVEVADCPACNPNRTTDFCNCLSVHMGDL
ncbi:MAG: rRNA adenine methyltransferase [Anaerolineae bacterium]|nr:rRNA adenine methyltransferase [Anaerolineae bacterium]